MIGSLSSRPGGVYAPSDTAKSWPWLMMEVEKLEEEVVRENPGQLPPEVPLREPVDTAVWLTSAIVKEGRPCGERYTRAALAGPCRH